MENQEGLDSQTAGINKENDIESMNDKIIEIRNILEEMRKEHFLMRENVLDILPIIKDFKGLIQRKSLFERSPFTYLNVLAREIKADILREVASKLLEPGDEIRHLKEDLTMFKDHTLDKFYELQDNLALLNSEKVVINERLANDDQIIAEIKEDLALKAPYREVNSLAEKVSTKAPLSELNELEEKVKICPTAEQVNSLNRQIEILNYQMSAYASKDMVFEMEQGITSKVSHQIQNYLKAEVFFEEVAKVRGEIKDTIGLIDYHKEKQEKITAAFRHEISKLNKTFQSKPWNHEIDIVMGFVNEKTDIKTTDSFKADVYPKLDFFDEKINIFVSQIKAFDLVLERYDELLLEKASKDDIDSIKAIHPSFLKVAEFVNHKEEVLNRVAELEIKSENHLTSLEIVEKKIHDFKSTYKIFNKDYKNFMAIYNSLGDIREQISAKANKSDILSLIDTSARREDLNLATQAIENLHKQLEMHIMLHLNILKTMLKSAESAAVKNRQRVDLYRSVSSLLNWLSNSIPPEADKLLNNSSRALNSSFRRSPKADDTPEQYFPMLILPKHSKKQTFLFSETPSNVKSDMDLPPLF
ncbi:unnamed protein product [Blepharisma stoltei]|uniref:Autophagy-related protein 17 n=1 Tax=Blepharisma stoltei TaxID=1481888 RepID=A0AAU9JYL2_9CILI|nr:unnamed protein product [Blepharisma stoltei]